jgi:hypothetical protein
MNTLKGRCATCKHWDGDKAKAMAMFTEIPISMDLHNGWPDSGECRCSHFWLNTEITGDAYVTSTVDANFGCIHWEEDDS